MNEDKLYEIFKLEDRPTLPKRDLDNLQWVLDFMRKYERRNRKH